MRKDFVKIGWRVFRRGIRRVINEVEAVAYPRLSEDKRGAGGVSFELLS